MVFLAWTSRLKAPIMGYQQALKVPQGSLRLKQASKGLQGVLKAPQADKLCPPASFSVLLFFGGSLFGQVWDLTMGMIGTKENPQFNAKGSETKNLLPWITSMFTEYESQFNELANASLKTALGFAKEACSAALSFETTLRENGRYLGPDATQSLFVDYMRFASMYERAGGNLVQKHHLMVHCVRDTSIFGNPRFYTTYRSESFNGVLAKIARNCYSSSFYQDMHIRAAALNARAISKHMV